MFENPLSPKNTRTTVAASPIRNFDSMKHSPHKANLTDFQMIGEKVNLLQKRRDLAHATGCNI